MPPGFHYPDSHYGYGYDEYYQQQYYGDTQVDDGYGNGYGFGYDQGFDPSYAGYQGGFYTNQGGFRPPPRPTRMPQPSWVKNFYVFHILILTIILYIILFV